MPTWVPFHDLQDKQQGHRLRFLLLYLKDGGFMDEHNHPTEKAIEYDYARLVRIRDVLKERWNRPRILSNYRRKQELGVVR